MELHEFGVFDGHTRAQARRHAVAGHVSGIGGATPVHAAEAAGGDDDRLGLKGLNLATAQVNGHDTLNAVPIAGDVQQVHLVQELDAVLQAILVERVQHNVTSLVSRVAAARMARTAEGTLRDAALLVARVRHAHALELEYQVGHARHEKFHCVLVGQEVASLDCVVKVALDGVGLVAVAQGRVHAALGRAGVAARGEHLREHRNQQVALLAGGQSRRHPRTAGADDDHIVSAHRIPFLLISETAATDLKSRPQI